MVSTLDVITPIVQDPYTFGQIAAANSLSDVFAMGGKVIYALNVCSFPKELSDEDSTQIMSGALSKLNEINAPLAGGHTVNEPSLLYGLSVNGIIEDGKYFANDMAKENQAIILTKPYGIGVVYAASKNDLLNNEDYDKWTKTMTTLNYDASVIARDYISTMTDVTGFGLLGHGYEVMKASNLSLELDFSKIKFLNNVVDYAKQGYLTGASYANYEYLKDKIDSAYDKTIDLLLCDPQTSGGLMLFVDEDKKDSLLKQLENNNIDAYCIGKTIKKSDKYLYIK